MEQTWPTTPDENGVSAPLLQVMADPLVGRQAMYLIMAARQIQEHGGLQPEEFQIPIVQGGLRTTIPAGFTDERGNKAMVYSHVFPWTDARIEKLKQWIRDMREIVGIPENVPVIVAGQYPCDEVQTIPGVQFACLPLLSSTPEDVDVDRPPAELASTWAGAFVGFMEEQGTSLDYSPASLDLVDAHFVRMRDAEIPVLPEALLEAGAYVGEVIRRGLNGTWHHVEGTPIEPVASGPIVLGLGGESFCNPLGKVRKLYELGPGDGVAFFFNALANRENFL